MSVAPLVLAYHAIGVAAATEPLYNTFVTPQAFASQMAFLARHREVVDLDAIIQDRSFSRRRPPVAITFDDGYQSVHAEAAPVLERYGFPATVFVPTKWIGQRNGWDSHSDLPLEVMGEDEIGDLHRRGFRIASHGHAHIDLGRVVEAEARADVITSVQVLTDLLGEHPRYLAYPYGRSSPATRRVVLEAGFELAFTLDRVEERAGWATYARTPVYPHDRRWLYAFKSSGRYDVWRHSPVVARSYQRLRPLLRGSRWWP